MLLGWPAAATAQATDLPFDNCRSFKITRLGESSAEPKLGSITGEVRVDCDGTSIFADNITWEGPTIRAWGRLLVIQDGLRITAERMEMDRRTRLGAFYNAYGTARITDTPPDRNQFGALEPEIYFEAEKLERLGPRTYRLTNGVFSTCLQANPRWEMRGTSGTVTLDEHAVLKNVVFRVKRVPVLYVPYLYYPLKKEDRATGFLLPTYSQSTIRGHGISNAFFWALGRSMDATLYHDYFSKTGQGAGADYRYVAAPGSRGELQAYVLMEKTRIAADGTVERPAHRSYDIRGSVNQRMGQFHLIGSANYFSDLTTQQLYQQNVYDLSNRKRSLSFTLSGDVVKGLRMEAKVERTEIFTGLNSALQSSAPKVNVWYRNTIGNSRVYYSASGEAARFENRPFGSTQPTAVRRLDANSTIQAPLSPLRWLSFTTTAGWRVTHWLDSLDPLTGLPTPEPITRSLFDLRAEAVGPVLSRVFRTPKSGYADGFKHLVEPRVSVQWLSPFDRGNEVIKLDPQIDGLVGGTTSVTYSLTNRVMTKRHTADGTGPVLPFFSVTVGQTYYSNALAGAVDAQYPTGSVGTFSPLQVVATVTPTDQISGSVRLYVNPTARALQSASVSTQFDLPRLRLSGGWSKQFVIPTVPGFSDPNSASHFLNANASVRSRNDRAGGTYGFHFDVGKSRLVQQRVGAYYNAQCCGISFDYQIISASPFQVASIGPDRRFAISFTLAGIGSFPIPLSGFGR